MSEPTFSFPNNGVPLPSDVSTDKDMKAYAKEIELEEEHVSARIADGYKEPSPPADEEPEDEKEPPPAVPLSYIDDCTKLKPSFPASYPKKVVVVDDSFSTMMNADGEAVALDLDNPIFHSVKSDMVDGALHLSQKEGNWIYRVVGTEVACPFVVKDDSSKVDDSTEEYAKGDNRANVYMRKRPRELDVSPYWETLPEHYPEGHQVLTHLLENVESSRKQLTRKLNRESTTAFEKLCIEEWYKASEIHFQDKGVQQQITESVENNPDIFKTKTFTNREGDVLGDVYGLASPENRYIFTYRKKNGMLCASTFKTYGGVQNELLVDYKVPEGILTPYLNTRSLERNIIHQIMNIANRPFGVFKVPKTEGVGDMQKTELVLNLSEQENQLFHQTPGNGDGEVFFELVNEMFGSEEKAKTFLELLRRLFVHTEKQMIRQRKGLPLQGMSSTLIMLIGDANCGKTLLSQWVAYILGHLTHSDKKQLDKILKDSSAENEALVQSSVFDYSEWEGSFDYNWNSWKKQIDSPTMSVKVLYSGATAPLTFNRIHMLSCNTDQRIYLPGLGASVGMADKIAQFSVQPTQFVGKTREWWVEQMVQNVHAVRKTLRKMERYKAKNSSTRFGPSTISENDYILRNQRRGEYRYLYRIMSDLMVLTPETISVMTKDTLVGLVKKSHEKHTGGAYLTDDRAEYYVATMQQSMPWSIAFKQYTDEDGCLSSMVLLRGNHKTLNNAERIANYSEKWWNFKGVDAYMKQALIRCSNSNIGENLEERVLIIDDTAEKELADNVVKMSNPDVVPEFDVSSLGIPETNPKADPVDFLNEQIENLKNH